MIYNYKENNCIIIPLDYNAFYCSLMETRKPEVYGYGHYMSSNLIKELEDFITQNSSQHTIILDTFNVYNLDYRSARFEHWTNVVFLNLISGSDLHNIVKTEFKDYTEENIEKISLFYSKRIRINNETRKSLLNYRERIYTSIIKKLTRNEITYLESSNVYSTCFVDIKKLFVSHNEDGFTDYGFLMFSLASVLSKRLEKHGISALVTASNNGAIIANMVASMLNAKVIHLIGIGPKYAMEVCDSLDCIREGKNYAYIFDVLCTGTELKIVSALINSKKAHLPIAAGLFKYKTDNELNMVKDLKVLLNSKEANLNYRIAGRKEDLL